MAEICLRQVFLVAGGCTFGESCRFDGTGCSIGSLRQCWSTYSRYWDLKKLWISTGKCRKCHKWFDFYAFKGIRRWIMEVCAQVFWGKFGKKVRTTQKRSHYMNIHVCIHIYIYILAYSGGWGGFRNFFVFHPKTLGFHDPIWRSHVFQLGWWTNHQLEVHQASHYFSRGVNIIIQKVHHFKDGG